MSDEAVTLHFLRKDGSESSAVIEPGADGGYTWTVPADCDGITGFTRMGARTGIAGGGAGSGVTGGVAVSPGKTIPFPTDT